MGSTPTARRTRAQQSMMDHVDEASNLVYGWKLEAPDTPTEKAMTLSLIRMHLTLGLEALAEVEAE